jgi:hypothetical protein
MAFLLQATGDYVAARLLIERALHLIETTLGSNHPRTAAVLQNLAIVELEIGNPQEALPGLARALAITRKHMVRGLVGISNRQKLAFLATTGGSTDTFLSLPSGFVADSEAYRAVLDQKNILFRTLATERSLVEAVPSPQVAALLLESAAVRRQLAAFSVGVSDSRNPIHYQTRFAGLSQRLEELEADLSRLSSTFRQAQMEVAAGASEVCAAVPVDSALIDLFWYPRYVPPATPGMRSAWTPHYAAFALRGGDCATPIRVDLGPAALIDKDIRRLREAISREAADPATRALRLQYRKTVAGRLAAVLFPPALREAIAGKSRLIIAPDGALALLPFALLPGEDGREFLLETWTISYIPSGRDLLRRGRPPQP